MAGQARPSRRAGGTRVEDDVAGTEVSCARIYVESLDRCGASLLTPISLASRGLVIEIGEQGRDAAVIDAGVADLPHRVELRVIEDVLVDELLKVDVDRAQRPHDEIRARADVAWDVSAWVVDPT